MMCVLYAIFTAISRITDHKHHSTDVMAGAALGAVMAVATVHRILVAGTDPPASRRQPSSGLKRLEACRDLEEDQLIEHFLRQNGDAADGVVLKAVLQATSNQ